MYGQINTTTNDLDKVKNDIENIRFKIVQLNKEKYKYRMVAKEMSDLNEKLAEKIEPFITNKIVCK